MSKDFFFSFPKGYKHFYDLEGNLIYEKELYPNFDSVIGVGGCLGGITGYIGFDVEYFLTEAFR